MWNITPEDVDRAKEELKGRHAAIQARYDDEIQKLVAELDDVEALDRVATAFAQRHKREEPSVSIEPDPIAPLEALPIAADPAVEAERMNRFDTHAENPGEVKNPSEADAPPVTAEAGVVPNASSRWRVRI
jgi:hypothetical protein